MLDCKHLFINDGLYLYKCLLCLRRLHSHYAIAERLEVGLFGGMTEAVKTDLLRSYLNLLI